MFHKRRAVITLTSRASGFCWSPNIQDIFKKIFRTAGCGYIGHRLPPCLIILITGSHHQHVMHWIALCVAPVGGVLVYCWSLKPWNYLITTFKLMCKEMGTLQRHCQFRNFEGLKITQGWFGFIFLLNACLYFLSSLMDLNLVLLFDACKSEWKYFNDFKSKNKIKLRMFRNFVYLTRCYIFIVHIY